MSANGKKDEKANGKTQSHTVKILPPNLVKIDGMLREAICNQEKANKTWEKKWGFWTQYTQVPGSLQLCSRTKRMLLKCCGHIGLPVQTQNFIGVIFLIDQIHCHVVESHARAMSDKAAHLIPTLRQSQSYSNIRAIWKVSHNVIDVGQYQDMGTASCLKFFEEEAKSRGISLEAIRKGSKQQEFTVETAFPVPPSPPIPRTSSGYIGWRSSLQSCSLEKVGPFYISPVHTIEPPDFPKQRPQLTIFIG